MKLREGEEEESEEEEKHKRKKRKGKKGKNVKDESASESEDNEEEPQLEDAKPIGEVVRLSGKGRGRRQHYEAFEYDGNRYDLVSLRFGLGFWEFVFIGWLLGL